METLSLPRLRCCQAVSKGALGLEFYSTIDNDQEQ